MSHAAQPNNSTRYYRPGEFQAIAPETKLDVSRGHVNSKEFSATIDKNNKIELTVSNSRQNSIELGYVRHDGSYSECQAPSTIRGSYGGRPSNLQSISAPGTYHVTVTHNHDASSTISVIPDPSLSAVKINMGDQTYYININDLKYKRDHPPIQQAEQIEQKKENAAQKDNENKVAAFPDHADAKSTTPKIENKAEAEIQTDVAKPIENTLNESDAQKLIAAVAQQTKSQPLTSVEHQLMSDLLRDGMAGSTAASIVMRNRELRARKNPNKQNAIIPETIQASEKVANAKAALKSPLTTDKEILAAKKELSDAQKKLTKNLASENKRITKQMGRLDPNSAEYTNLEAELKANKSLPARMVIRQAEIAEAMASSSDAKISKAGKNTIVGLRKAVPAMLDQMADLDPANKQTYLDKKTTFKTRVEGLVNNGEANVASKVALKFEKLYGNTVEKSPILRSISANGRLESSIAQIEKLSAISDLQELHNQTDLKKLEKTARALANKEVKLKAESIADPTKVAEHQKIQAAQSKLSLLSKKVLDFRLQVAETLISKTASPATPLNPGEFETIKAADPANQLLLGEHQNSYKSLKSELYRKWGSKISEALPAGSSELAQFDSAKTKYLNDNPTPPKSTLNRYASRATDAARGARQKLNNPLNGSPEKFTGRVAELQTLSEAELVKRTSLKQLGRIDAKLVDQERSLRVTETSTPGKDAALLEKVQESRRQLALTTKKYLENQIAKEQAAPKPNLKKIEKLEKSLNEEWKSRIEEGQTGQARRAAQSSADALKTVADDFDRQLNASPATKVVNEYLTSNRDLVLSKMEVSKLQAEIADPKTSTERQSVLKTELDKALDAENAALKRTIKTTEAYQKTINSTSQEGIALAEKLDVLKAEAEAHKYRTTAVGKNGARGAGVDPKGFREAKLAEDAVNKDFEDKSKALKAETDPVKILEAEKEMIESKTKAISAQDDVLNAESKRYEIGLRETNKAIDAEIAKVDANAKLTDAEKIQRKQVLEQQRQIRTAPFKDAIALNEHGLNHNERLKDLYKNKTELNAAKMELHEVETKIKATPKDVKLIAEKSKLLQKIHGSETVRRQKLSGLRTSFKEKFSIARERYLTKNIQNPIAAVGLVAASESVFSAMKADYSKDAVHSPIPTLVGLLDRGYFHQNWVERTEFTTGEKGKYASVAAEMTKTAGDIGIAGTVIGIGTKIAPAGGRFAVYATPNVLGLRSATAMGVRSTSMLGRVALGPIGMTALGSAYAFSAFSSGNIGEMDDLELYGTGASPVVSMAIGGTFIAGPLGTAVGGGIGLLFEGAGAVRGSFVLAAKLDASTKMREIKLNLERGINGFVFPPNELAKYSGNDRLRPSYTPEESEVLDNYAKQEALLAILIGGDEEYPLFTEQEVKELGFTPLYEGMSKQQQAAAGAANWERINQLTVDDSWFGSGTSREMGKLLEKNSDLKTKFDRAYNISQGKMDKTYQYAMRSIFVLNDKTKPNGGGHLESDLSDYTASLVERGVFEEIDDQTKIVDVKLKLTEYFPNLDTILANRDRRMELINSFSYKDPNHPDGRVPGIETPMGRRIFEMFDLDNANQKLDEAEELLINQAMASLED